MAGRKPKSECQKKTRRQNVNLTDEDDRLVKELASRLGCSEQEAFRRGVQQLAARAESGEVPMALRMSGDSDTLGAKKKAIEAFSVCGTVAVAAHRAGVTVGTVQYWSKTDPVFAQLANEAQALSVGLVKAKMYEDAIAGNTSAQFGILNAHDPHFGQIRTAMIQRVIEPLLDAVVENARRYLSTEQLERFAAECSRSGERVALKAVGGRSR